MKALLVILSMISAPALADGFDCKATDSSIRVKAYNEVSPEHGTRNSAVMVVSDPSVNHGRKTIAKFEAADGLLYNSGSRYTAIVDLRYRDSSRKGEHLGSTKLGEIDEIVLDVDFTYSQPVEDEDEVNGELILNLRNGETRSFELICERYLKN